MTDTHTLAEQLKQVIPDCTCEVAKTGSHEWVRMYIKQGSVYLARASFRQGILYSIKWHTHDYTPMKFNCFVKHGILVTDFVIAQLKEKAYQLAWEQYRAKQKWRKANNQSKKRKALAHPDQTHAKYLYDLIRQWCENGGDTNYV